MTPCLIIVVLTPVTVTAAIWPFACRAPSASAGGGDIAVHRLDEVERDLEVDFVDENEPVATPTEILRRVLGAPTLTGSQDCFHFYVGGPAEGDRSDIAASPAHRGRLSSPWIARNKRPSARALGAPRDFVRESKRSRLAECGSSTRSMADSTGGGKRPCVIV